MPLGLTALVFASLAVYVDDTGRRSRSDSDAVAKGFIGMPGASPANNQILVVDDDVDVRNALALVFTIEGYGVTAFSDAASFFAVARARFPACVLLDICMPVKSGLDVLKEIDARNYPAPIFAMSGSGNISMAVEAINEGACDFMEKRLGTAPMIARVREAIEDRTRPKRGSKRDQSLSASLPGWQLTPRERDVLREIMAAASSKEAARSLSISPRTIENYRVSIMQKLGARNTVDLARIVLVNGRVGG
jgi:two-component system response regulator FixJ